MKESGLPLASVSLRYPSHFQYTADVQQSQCPNIAQNPSKPPHFGAFEGFYVTILLPLDGGNMVSWICSGSRYILSPTYSHFLPLIYIYQIFVGQKLVTVCSCFHSSFCIFSRSALFTEMINFLFLETKQPICDIYYFNSFVLIHVVTSPGDYHLGIGILDLQQRRYLSLKGLFITDA